MAATPVPQVQPPAIVAALPPCAEGALAVSFDREDGAFAGMSHDGALLVVRNIGAAACRVPGLPVLSFADASRKALPIARMAPLGLHPGPVVLPVGLAAGAEATAGLLWVVSPVFGNDGGRCYSATSVTVSFDGVSVTAPISTTICGPTGKPATFEQNRLAVDPVL